MLSQMDWNSGSSGDLIHSNVFLFTHPMLTHEGLQSILIKVSIESKDQFEEPGDSYTAYNNNYVDLYSARIHQLSGAQGALLPLLIRLIHHS